MPNKQKNELKKIRKSFGLTLKEFSRQLGLPMGTYKKYEYGERHQPVWLPILIEKFKHETLLKNKDMREISITMLSAFKEHNWDDSDLETFIKILNSDIKSIGVKKT